MKEQASGASSHQALHLNHDEILNLIPGPRISQNMNRTFFFFFILGAALTCSMEVHQAPLSTSIWGYFTPPVLKRPQKLQTPMEAMVDLTNSLGVSILQDHSYSRGNFAFSPYGVASVLVVLYEGTRGESANQIYRAVGLPSNKDVLRMGFRNIHRHLKSYFSHEGFLSGITLNKNGSDLKPEYKKILKYYGYDVDLNTSLDDDSKVDQNTKPSDSQTAPTKTTVTTTLQPDTENPSLTTEAEKEEKDTKDTTTEAEKEEKDTKDTTTEAEKEEKDTKDTTTEAISEETATKNMKTVSRVTKEEQTEKTEDGDNYPTITSMSTVTETLPTTEKIGFEDFGAWDTTIATGINEEVLSTTEYLSTNEKTIDQTTESVTESSTETPTTEQKITSSMKDMLQFTKAKETTGLSPTELLIDLLQVLEPDDNKEDKYQKNLKYEEKKLKCRRETSTTGSHAEDETDCKKDIETTQPEIKAPEGKTESNANKLDNGMLIPQPNEGPTTTKADLRQTTSGSSFFQSTAEAIHANKRSGEETSLEEPSSRNSLRTSNKITTRRDLKSNGGEWEKLRKIFSAKSTDWALQPRKKRKKTRGERHRRTIADYLKWPLHPDLSLQLQNGMYDTHVSRNAEMYRGLPRLNFLVDGAIDTPVPMMTYTNIFPYGYIPHLHAKALEFPLDDIRYKLLIVLPVERRGLRQLIYDLSTISVRGLVQCLKPTRVKAIIPTFMVEGFVILTSSLQKLGIWDVFDPRKANLSGMSVDPELYVRNVEQSVTVVIKNYVEILDIQTRTMAARFLVQEFEATHPFVYFVLDTATNVALMAGQMLDPLNSRIY